MKFVLLDACIYFATINPKPFAMLTKLYPLITDKSWRSLLVQNDRLYLINNTYKTEQEFLDSYEKKGLLKKKKEIEVNSISSFSHPESTPRRLNINAATGKVFMDFASTSDLEEVADYLQKQRRFTAETKGIGKFKAISGSLIGLAVTAFITFVVYQDALVLESGGYVETSGRRSLYKMLFAWLAENLGSRNTLIVGGLVGLICLYFMYKALQNPPNEVVYQ